ncbi:MAG: hypothetical protein ACR2LQ_11375 [Acidimicrobiales bacterium]
MILLIVGGITLAILQPGNLADDTKTNESASTPTTRSGASSSTTSTLIALPSTTAASSASASSASSSTASSSTATSGIPTTSTASTIAPPTTQSAGGGLGQTGSSKADANGETANTGGESMLGLGLLLSALALAAHYARRRAPLR